MIGWLEIVKVVWGCPSLNWYDNIEALELAPLCYLINSYGDGAHEEVIEGESERFGLLLNLIDIDVATDAKLSLLGNLSIFVVLEKAGMFQEFSLPQTVQ